MPAMSKTPSTPQYQRGANPLLQTRRGKVQQRRGALNEQISKQIRLRNGAENLLKVTRDKRIRDQIYLELSFLDSNLQLLKEELSELNADVQIYQNENCSTAAAIPQLAFGLKETKDVDFSIAFKGVIVDHYYEDPSKFDAAVRKFSELRKVIRTPPRNESGIQLLMEYYNHLCYAEKRFYSVNRPLNTHFEWFDAITGFPSIQKSIAFEKGSILFNVAALFTQLGANEDRNVQMGQQKCLDYYGRAVGCLHYLKENFSHAPSNDMRTETLIALIHLLLAQIQECVWEICYGQLYSAQGFHESFVLAQESSQVSKMYSETYHALCSLPYQPYLPTAWSILACVKRDFFCSLAHYFTAVGVSAIKEISPEVNNRFKCHFLPNNAQHQTVPDLYAEMSKLHNKPGWSPEDAQRVPSDPAKRKLIVSMHLKYACQLIEECTSGIKLNKSLRKMNGLCDYIKKFSDTIICKQSEIADVEVDNFLDLYEPQAILPKTAYPAIMITPDFKRCSVDDLFAELGPLSVFNAKNDLTPVKIVELHRTASCPGFGFSVKGDTPVTISSVENGGLAAMCNLVAGDYIVAVNDEDCRWSSHEQVVQLIRQAGDCLRLSVVSHKCPPSDSVSVYSHNSTSTLSSSPSLANSGQSVGSPKVKGCHDASDGVSVKSSWLSSTLPSTFRNIKKEPKKFVAANGCSLVGSENGNELPRKPCQEISTFGSVKSMKDKKTNSSSPGRIRSLLTLRKNKSDSRLNGSIFMTHSR